MAYQGTYAVVANELSEANRQILCDMDNSLVVHTRDGADAKLDLMQRVR